MRLGKLVSIAVVLLTLVSGCKREPDPVPITPANPAKGALEGIAASGELGSGIMDVESGVNELRKTDAAKADKLAKDLEDLRAETDSAKIKSKAKAMADQF